MARNGLRTMDMFQYLNIVIMKSMWKYEFNSNDTCGYIQIKDTGLWTIKRIWIWTGTMGEYGR